MVEIGEPWIGKVVGITIDVDHMARRLPPRKARILKKIEPPLSEEYREDWLAELDEPVSLLFPRPRKIRMVLIRYPKVNIDVMAYTFHLPGTKVGCSNAAIYGVKPSSKEVKSLRPRDMIWFGMAQVYPASQP